MSRISNEEVARIAQLARIELSANEVAELAGEMEAILGAVARVQEAAKSDVVPTSHPLALVNVTRPDVVRPGLTPASALSGAPASEDDRFRVPQILGEEA
ncbi:MAG: Asp-tRNA(Asn)/Glu-tRNA(Gln) amidotransferase subunit GatC [Actinomycetes bacterium]